MATCCPGATIADTEPEHGHTEHIHQNQSVMAQAARCWPAEGNHTGGQEASRHVSNI